METKGKKYSKRSCKTSTSAASPFHHLRSHRTARPAPRHTQRERHRHPVANHAFSFFALFAEEEKNKQSSLAAARSGVSGMKRERETNATQRGVVGVGKRGMALRRWFGEREGERGGEGSCETTPPPAPHSPSERLETHTHTHTHTHTSHIEHVTPHGQRQGQAHKGFHPLKKRAAFKTRKNPKG